MPQSRPLITAIRVEGLFGLYTYSMPATGQFQDAAILYGDNGVGKSTILRLTFHLLSAASDRGHRTAIYKTDFSTFEVDLASGATVRAERRRDKNADVLELSVLAAGRTLAKWDYTPGRKKSGMSFSDGGHYFIVDDDEVLPHYLSSTNVRSLSKRNKPVSQFPQGEQAFYEALKKYVPTMFILNADRRLDSDSVPNPSDEIELRKVMRYEEAKHLNDLVARSREIALSQALGTANSWVSKKALQGANQGSMNVHSVYIDVLHHVIRQSSEIVDAVTRDDVATLIAKLRDVEAKTESLARYELATKLSVGELYKALRSRTIRSSRLAAELLKPYVASLQGRLDAVEPVYHVIDRFVTILNQFLSDKSLLFRLSQGFRIENRLSNALGPAQLSSGEQQLLLLFCYVLTARDNPSVFIIDEPEISLNVKWQRRLVQSLLDVTDGANTQFIFASHSMELLAQHRGRVVKLSDLR